MANQDGRTFILDLNVKIRQTTPGGGYCGDGLQINESLEVKADTFLEVCQILGQFHALAEALKKKT